MGPVLASSSSGSWKRAAVNAGLAAILLAGAYQLPATMDVDFANAPAGYLSTEGFHDAEAGYRWSRARSEIHFHDPGAKWNVRLELLLSGFRPRDLPPPLLIVETPGRTFRLKPSRKVEPFAMDVSTRGNWSSTLRVVLRSEVFTPGGGDERSLGVRVHRARLATSGRAIPPIRQLFFGSLLVFLVGLYVPALGRWYIAMPALLAISFVYFRQWAAMALPPIAVGLALVVVVARFVPSVTSLARSWSKAVSSALLQATPSLLELAIVAGVATGAAVVAYAGRPIVELDLGSSAFEPIVRRFRGYDRDALSVHFREPLPGAVIDLRDFGAGRPWKIAIRAALEGDAQLAVLARADGAELRTELGPTWESHSFTAPAPDFSWRSGYELSFAGFAGAKLKISSIRVDRGSSLPSARAILFITISAWAFLFGLRGMGLRERGATWLAVAWLVVPAGAVLLSPAVAIPLLPLVVVASVATSAVAILVRGGLLALAERDIVPELAPGVLVVASLGFLAWFLAMASPLYVGGHFAYHTAIAEEIWQGKFLLYYLPDAANMLSRQPQWGGLVVPHPSLYHTVSSPFAGLPHFWFLVGTKLFVAGLLFMIPITCGLVATVVADARAGVFAAAATLVPTGFQLLALGHLMTIFGCAAATVALGLLAVCANRLSEKGIFWLVSGALTISFLSYTGTLLFGSAALALTAVISYRSDRDFSKSLVKLSLVSWTLAFLLYYVHWAVPFVRDTLPVLLFGAGGERTIDLGARAAAVPSKFTYSFGSFLIPLGGLLGIALVEGRSRARRLLEGWALVLVLFTLLDLGFNFLLKHHYFSWPVVALGLGFFLHRLDEKGRLGRVTARVSFLALIVSAVRAAIRVATGGG